MRKMIKSIAVVVKVYCFAGCGSVSDVPDYVGEVSEVEE